MSGYSHQPPGYGYGYGYDYEGARPPRGGSYAPSPYAPSAPQPQDQSHGQPYGAPPAPNSYGRPGHTDPHAPAHYATTPGTKPPKDHGQSVGGYGHPPPASSTPGYANPFASLLPSAFPPGTDASIVACFQVADEDGSGFIDDKELQRALSSYNQTFSMRTVHLLMYSFTNTNTRKIGPKEFTQLFYSLQNWRSIFERFDKDRSGRIDAPELREALLSMGFAVPPVVLDLLVSKFDKSGGQRAIEYDNFIECCLTVKGLTEKFKERDTAYTGSATFSYELFMLTVLPFLIA